MRHSYLLLQSLIVLLLLTACTDHVSEAESILEDRQKFLTHIAQLNQDFQFETQLSFSSPTIGANLNQQTLRFKSKNLNPEFNYTMNSFTGETQVFNLEVRDSIIEWTTDDFITDTTQLNPSPTAFIGVGQGASNSPVASIELPKALVHKCHQVFTRAENQFADNQNSLLNSLVQSLKMARTHLTLALNGNHALHLRHTAQFLYGREGRNPEWAQTAPINSVDTISVTQQINYLAQYLVDQAEWASDEHQDALLELNTNLGQFQTRLALKMDLIGDWFDLEAPSSDVEAQNLIILLDEWIPQFEGFIEKIDSHLVRRSP